MDNKMSAVWNNSDNHEKNFTNPDNSYGLEKIQPNSAQEKMSNDDKKCANEKSLSKSQKRRNPKEVLKKISVLQSPNLQKIKRKVNLKKTNYLPLVSEKNWEANYNKRKESAKTGAIPKHLYPTQEPGNKRCIKPMSFSQIKILVRKSTNEVLFTIIDEESGFILLLEQSIKRDCMAYILLALSKAITSNMSCNVLKVIHLITSQSNFFLIHVQQYLATFFQPLKTEQYHLDSIVSLSLFLYKFQISFPSNASDILLILLPLLKQTSEKCLLCHEGLYSEVSRRLQAMEEQNQLFLQKHSVGEIKNKILGEKLQQLTPPENFRSIPILPSSVDIHQSCPFLRPNKIKGQYEDAEHYLDVQYRLLREDYVKPLRDGISEYLTLKKLGKPLNHCKDIQVYQNVLIIKQEFVNGSLIHMAQFPNKNFSNVNWEYSKRFLTGSLLCLSTDNFSSMMFAFVAKRDPKELLKGLLFLKFANMSDKTLNISPTKGFTVIETTAYFEAYRYNLESLIQLKEETLPMKRYIIETKKDVQAPKYLNENIRYDLRPLFLPLGKIKVEYAKEAKSKLEVLFKRSKNITPTKISYPSHIPETAKAIKILDDKSWPSHLELNLDTTQYAAIKAAVTKEFVVIQGPPGTGKTFVGLRIAQLLLHNLKQWQTDTKQLPILVICYTNHALDQFLEGLLLFTSKLVRVGGRGTNESVSKFQLNNLKTKIKENRELPHYIFASIRNKYLEVQEIKKTIDEIKASINRSSCSILKEDELRTLMLPKHYYSLEREGGYHNDKGNLFKYWLLTSYRDRYQATNSPLMSNSVSNTGQMNMPLENLIYHNLENNRGEGDIDYIEAQRDLDSNELVGASYDLPNIEGDTGNDFNLAYEDGWEIHGGTKALKRYIKRQLNHCRAMKESQTKQVLNVWKLNVKQRWRLYKYWVEKFTHKLKKDSLCWQQKLKKEYEELCEMRIEEDINVCQEAHVIGMTTTGAAKYRHIVQHLNPKILIVEEAAEILECHIVTSFAQGTEHVILIGDHQQLRPSPTVHLLATKYNLNISLFERMLENGLECHKLGIQHRMRPDIACLLVPYIYSDLKNHVSVNSYESIKGTSKNVFFLSHSNSELQEYDSKSRVNQHEAKFLLKLCKYLLLQGYKASQITVLTTYSGQLFEMKRLCGAGLLEDVKMTVVDNYQGEENDIILISFVRSNEDGQIGFLKISNRVCVALSRAKKGLFCIGNFNLLAEKSDLWQNIVNQLEKNGAIGPSLQLTCQNHPNVQNIVATEKDFDSVPEGGCTKKCEFRLTCGHVCVLMCHPYDMEHDEINCLKPCSKYCKDGHLCPKKCFEKCGDCKFKQKKTFTQCGHTISVFCSQKETISCTNVCEKYLSCGHACVKQCGDPCTSQCKENVRIRSKICGHYVTIECFASEDNYILTKYCEEPCQVELTCGHICSGNCYQCYQGRLHISCEQDCKRILVCGHECQAKCLKSCPPCTHKCLNKCIHSQCPKRCGEPCKRCKEPCAWKCPHKKCNQLCGDICDRTACEEPCLQLLNCGHPCIGLCGEPCPKECRVCDEEMVKEIFFGSEDEVNAHFVTLEDCGHIFEVNGLTHWMNHDKQEKKEVQMKTCPKCKVVIRKNLRFGNIIKSCLTDVEKVKKIIYGDRQKNKKIKDNLLHCLQRSGATRLWEWTCHSLVNSLESKQSWSTQEITTMENLVTIIISLINVTSSFNCKVTSNNTFNNVSGDLEVYIKDTERWIKTFIRNNYLSTTEQQLQDLTWEAHRLKLANKLLDVIQKQFSLNHIDYAKRLIDMITTYAPFHIKESELFIEEFKNFAKLIDGADLNVSGLEKQTILKAMGLSKGHWYQCPKGHVYCITECGGAMEESTCNECGEKIGGKSHTLLSSNKVATAMDGAKHPAWSEEMNMNNYRF